MVPAWDLGQPGVDDSCRAVVAAGTLCRTRRAAERARGRRLEAVTFWSPAIVR
jgi:hypothetical protein